MERERVLELLGGWTGFEVGEVERRPGKPPEIWITLRPRSDEPLRCGRCGAEASGMHDQTWREVRDLPLFDARTYLRVLVYRVWCARCAGPRRMRIEWLDDHQRITRRLADSVIQLCALLPIRHVARFYGLDWHTVKRLDKEALRARLEPVDWSSVRVIGMDEFAMHKGHRYATVVVEPSIKRVLWVGPGHGRKDVRVFFELLGRAGCRRLEAVVMDMNGAYEREVRRHCPQARIVFDLYHVVAKYAREVVTRVRSAEVERLAHEPAARRVIQSSRWLLVRNREKLSADEVVRLDELLEANRALMTVYVLKEDLKQLWRFRCEREARRFFGHWYARAMASGIAPVMRFAERLKPYLHGILAHCRWPLHTGLIEGINNRIKVIKRMAYGYRDQEYFFLKIRAAFPGVAR